MGWTDLGAELPQDDNDNGTAVPTWRAMRLLRFGGIASGIVGCMAVGGPAGTD
ncbi:MAG: hypothetical protein H7245_18330 [Candidatus Saccharibacteria bacterium]|nr:hypothetical protein [Pseudorhodobacter sp.]